MKLIQIQLSPTRFLSWGPTTSSSPPCLTLYLQTQDSFIMAQFPRPHKPIYQVRFFFSPAETSSWKAGTTSSLLCTRSFSEVCLFVVLQQCWELHRAGIAGTHFSPKPPSHRMERLQYHPRGTQDSGLYHVGSGRIITVPVKRPLLYNCRSPRSYKQTIQQLIAETGESLMSGAR